jgi:hypothetical protein
MNVAVSDELLVALTELRTLFPDWRFGQMIANLVLAAGRDGAVWDIEDQELVTAARRLIDRNGAPHDSSP